MKIYSALLLAGMRSFHTSRAGDGLPQFKRDGDRYLYDLSDVFTSGNNQPGQVVTLPEKSGWVGVNATCPAGTTVNYTYRSYVSELPVQSTEGNFKYLKLNDYLLGAMSITDSVAGVFYPPRNYIRMGVDSNVSQQKPFGVQDSKLVLN